MACAYGEPTAEDCAIKHWCGALGARPEADGWRAPCPVLGCPTRDKRLFKFSIRGKGIGWTSFCPHHDKDFLRPILRDLLKGCLGGKSGPAPIEPSELIDLALAKMPPTSLRLALLELAGMSTPEALDKLGVRREHRSRVISGRAPKLVQRRR